jgi:hypothetical protein
MVSECFGVEDGGVGIMWRKSSTEWITKAFLLDGVLVADAKGATTPS